MTERKIPDTNPFVRIIVKNQKGQTLFYSSDPFEIERHNLNGLGIDCYIDIDEKRYTIEDLSVTVLSSPMDYSKGVDFNQNEYRGREIPFICDIKIKVS